MSTALWRWAYSRRQERHSTPSPTAGTDSKGLDHKLQPQGRKRMITRKGERAYRRRKEMSAELRFFGESYWIPQVRPSSKARRT